MWLIWMARCTDIFSTEGLCCYPWCVSEQQGSGLVCCFIFLLTCVSKKNWGGGGGVYSSFFLNHVALMLKSLSLQNAAPCRGTQSGVYSKIWLPFEVGIILPETSSLHRCVYWRVPFYWSNWWSSDGLAWLSVKKKKQTCAWECFVMDFLCLWGVGDICDVLAWLDCLCLFEALTCMWLGLLPAWVKAKNTFFGFAQPFCGLHLNFCCVQKVSL